MNICFIKSHKFSLYLLIIREDVLFIIIFVLVQEANQADIATPAIDAALEKFRTRGVLTSDTSATLTSDHDLSHAERTRSANVSHASQQSTQVNVILRRFGSHCFYPP